MEQPTAAPKIIYIVGSGHSGSTLLELILATAPGAFSVGGFRYIDRFINKTYGEIRDDTGYTAEDSPMWSGLAKDFAAYQAPQPIGPTLSRLDKLSIVLTGRPRVSPHTYDNGKLYRYVQQQGSVCTGEPVTHIIDSSKTLGRLIELNERSGLEVFVIYVVRDIRGVINSNSKRKKPLLKSARYWIANNLYTQAYLKRSVPEKRQLTVPYVDFVRRPQHYIDLIMARTGLTIDMEHIAEHINNQQSYRFSGNEMRRQPFSAIRLDEKWRHELPLVYRIVFAPFHWWLSKGA